MNYMQLKKFYKFTSILIFIMISLIIFQIGMFILFPPPETVEEIFNLFHKNFFLGLVSLDLLYIINNIILIFIYLALFFKLYKENLVLSLVALILGIIGISTYFSSNPSFEMLNLSSKFFSASIAYQNQLLSAGEALIAHYMGTAFTVYYILNAIVLLIFSFLIIKSKKFSKVVGIMAILSGVFMIIPSNMGTIGLIFSVLSLIPWIIFLIFFAIDISKKTME